MQKIINEFMSSNATTIADEDGDYPEWIELHNYGDNDLNILGWGISNLHLPDLMNVQLFDIQGRIILQKEHTDIILLLTNC